MPNRQTPYGFVSDLKRNELSRYCLNECRGNPCCTDLHRFALDVTPSQLSLLYEAEFKERYPEMPGKHDRLYEALGEKISNLASEGRLVQRKPKKIEDARKDVYDYLGPVCPRYEPETRLCQIYDSPDRPEECKCFPISLIRKEGRRPLVMDGGCQFIRQKWEDIFKELNKEWQSLSQVIIVPDYSNPAVPGAHFFGLPEHIEDARKALSCL